MFEHPTHQEIDRIKFEIEKLEDCDRIKISEVLELLTQMQSELPATTGKTSSYTKQLMQMMIAESKARLEEKQEDVSGDT